MRQTFCNSPMASSSNPISRKAMPRLKWVSGSSSSSSGVASSRSKFCRRSPKTLGVRAGSGARGTLHHGRHVGNWELRRLQACGAAVGAGSEAGGGQREPAVAARLERMNGAVAAATVPARRGYGRWRLARRAAEAISKLSPSSVSNSAASELSEGRRRAACGGSGVRRSPAGRFRRRGKTVA